MRTEEDILEFDITWHGRLSIDLERLAEDQQWGLRASLARPGNGDELTSAIHAYLKDLLMQDPFLTRAAFTNGPTEPIYVEIEKAVKPDVSK